MTLNDPLRTARALVIWTMISALLCAGALWASLAFIDHVAGRFATVDLIHQETALGSSFRTSNGGK